MLPQGFTRVEYIESTGTQYIDSGQIINEADNRKIIMTAQFTSDTSLGGANGYLQLKSDIASGNKAEIVIDYNGSTHVTSWYVNGALTSSQDWTYSYSGANVKIGLFRLGDAGNTWYSGTSPQKGKKWDWKLYAGDTLLVDMIMAVNASGAVGMYDDVAGIFRTNAGSGTFIAGPALVPDVPANLTQSTEGTTVTLTWSASEYANEYAIYRDGTLLDTVYGTITYYTDTEVDVAYNHTYTITPYNGTQAGTGASITVRASIDTPANLNAVVDGRTVALTWDAVNGAEGYKVYRDGAVVASVASTAYTDTLTPPASVAYAVSAYSGAIHSEISQTVVVENWEGVLLTLITDRAAADVAEAKRVRDKFIAGEALTDEESARYFAGLRGCYNASDMNRVGAAVRYVANRLNAEGYGAYVSPKTDWQMEDIVRQSDWNKYLDEVRHLRRKLTLMRTTPQITDGMYSGLKSYAEANAIEQILVDLDWMLTNIIRNYIYAGEVFAGEV